jgi:hypothetical protein
MNVNSVFSTIEGVIRAAIALIITAVGGALAVDVLFGQHTIGIVNNVTTVISAFTTQGVVGFIALIIFIAIVSRD